MGFLSRLLGLLESLNLLIIVPSLVLLILVNQVNLLEATGLMGLLDIQVKTFWYMTALQRRLNIQKQCFIRRRGI